MSAAQIHVERGGSGPKVVLLHSSGLSGRQWKSLVPGLRAKGLETLAVDLAGHGAAPPWPDGEPFSYRSDVDAVAALISREGGAHVIAHSYGALVGILAALVAPEKILSLTLFEPVAFKTLDPVRDRDALAELEAIDFRWADTDRERWLATFVDYWGGPGAWNALREEARAEFRRVGWVVREGVRTLLLDETPLDAYRAIDRPVRFFHGERSPLAARRVIARLASVLPQASVHAIEGAGHMAPLTHAAVANPLVLEAF